MAKRGRPAGVPAKTLNIKIKLDRDDDSRLYNFFNNQSLPDQLIKHILENFVSDFPEDNNTDILGETLQNVISSMTQKTGINQDKDGLNKHIYVKSDTYSEVKIPEEDIKHTEVEVVENNIRPTKTPKKQKNIALQHLSDK